MIFLFATLLSFISCGERQMQEQIRRFQSSPVDLCLDSMLQIPTRNDINNKNTNYTYVIYIDSLQCFSCSNNRLYMWETILKNYSNISICMIYSACGTEEDIVRNIKRKRFQWPIYVDTAKVFERNNRYLPSSTIFHTFMINAFNEVVLVGDPNVNEKISSLMRDIINNKT